MASTSVEQYYKVAGLERGTEVAACVRRHLTFQWLIGFLTFWLNNTHAAQHCFELSASQQARQEVFLTSDWQQSTATKLWVQTSRTHFQATGDEPPEIGHSTRATFSGDV